MTSNTELKPCPFCGGKAVEHEQQGGFIVACSSANKCAFSPSHWTKDKRKHRRNIAAWNTRASLETELAQLRSGEKEGL
jgi:ssDNA-binding Zn-finger/Zn-ribbon topoisomerase 1